MSENTDLGTLVQAYDNLSESFDPQEPKHNVALGVLNQEMEDTVDEICELVGVE